MDNNNSIETYIKRIKGGFIDREHYWRDLPIPQNWEHYISYPNDECPSFLVKNYWQVFTDHPEPNKRYGYIDVVSNESKEIPRFVIVPYDWGWLENSENWDYHHTFYTFEEVISFVNDHRNMIDKFLNQRKV